MKKLGTLFILICLIHFSGFNQSVQKLYEARNYEKLIKLEKKANTLEAIELYYVGYAFFQLEDDKKAIQMYNKAIEKGLDDDIIYLYKGLSLRYDRQYDEAIKTFRIAINRNPQGQKNYTELANCFYFQEQYDSALVYFEIARELTYELGDPYFKVPYVYHIQGNYKKALEEYYNSSKMINKQDPKYVEIMQYIGQLQFVHFKDYPQSINAYTTILERDETNYDLYTKLIKAYYSNENFEQGDSLFQILKTQYDNENLSADYQKFGSVAISEFEWNERTLIAYKYFDEPTETLDIMYKVYLLSEDGKTIERTFMTEKTIQLGDDGTKHLLCERKKDGGHSTYAYGWNSDEIDFNSLKNAVISILKEDLTPGASSNFGTKKNNK